MNLRTARQGKSEKVAVTTGAVATLTKNTIKPNPDQHTGASEAYITVEGTIRFTLDGTDPVVATKIGHPWFSGGPLIIDGEQNLLNLKMIAETADTTVYVTYF